MQKPLLRKALNLEPGEGKRAALMFSYIFLLIATLLVVKPVRNSLFLTHFGIEMLPYAFLLVAVVSGVFVAIYTRVANKVRLDRLIQYTLGSSVATIIILWLLLQLHYEAGWFFFLLYVWVAIFGVLVTTQFWLLANYVFNVREAKRIFGLLGAGGIAGGIFGGYFTNILAPFAGSEDLLLFGALFLIGCMVLVQFVWSMGAQEAYREQTQRRRKRQSADFEGANPLQIVFGNRYLTLLATLIGIGVIIANLVDYQYSAIATSVITDEDKLTAFFGFWLSTLSVFSLVIQLLLTSRVLRRYGVGGSLYFLPGGVLVGSIMVLISGGLTSAVMIKLFEGGFKQSIHKAGLELLWLPIPTSVKNRVKAFIDIFVDNTATGIGGLLLILLADQLGWGIGGVSGLIIGLVAVWLVLNVIVRREYVQSFRTAIEKRSIRLDQQVVNAQDPALLETVIPALETGNQKQVLYALDLIEHVRHEEIKKRLTAVFERHPSRDVITRVLHNALHYDDLDLRDMLQPYLEHEDAEIRVAVVTYLVTWADDQAAALTELLANNSVRVRMAALRVTAELGRHQKNVRTAIDFQRQFESLLMLFDEQTAGEEPDEELISALRVELAEVLGAVNLPELYPYLHMLLADESVPVLRAAVRAAGSTQSDEFLYTLVAHLNTKYVRKTARDALAMYGEAQIPMFIDRLNDPTENQYIRLSIPGVLARIGTQAAAKALQDNLVQDNIHLRHECIRSLNRLRNEYEDLRLDRSQLDENLLEEARTYYFTLEILQQQVDGRDSVASRFASENFPRARKLLVRALEERLDRNLEIIFRLLGLRYVPEDMKNAYMQVTGLKMDLRADAIEFLDNVLDQKLKRVVLPMVETPNVDVKLEHGRELFSHDPPSGEYCLQMLLEGDDDWLKVCTLYAIGESGDRSLSPMVEAHLMASERIVRETADLAYRRLNIELDKMGA